MPSLRDLLDFILAGWFPALVAMLAASGILAGNYYELPYVSGAPAWVLTTVSYIFILASSIVVANALRLPAYAWNSLMAPIRRRRRRSKIVEAIGELSQVDKSILAYLFSSDRQVFAAQFGDRRLISLVGKGMIRLRSGAHSQLSWPHYVDEEVWDILKENGDAIRHPVDNKGEDPFHWRNSPL